MKPIENSAKPQLSADVRNVFTDAATRSPGDFAKQAQQIVPAHRPAGLPEQFQPRLMGQWDDLFKNYEQRKRAEEAAKPPQPSEADAEQLKRNREERAAELGKKSCRELENILRQKQIDQLISRAWVIPNPSIVHEPEVRYQASDDYFINSSQVFISRKYTYKETASSYTRGQFSTSGAGYAGSWSITNNLKIQEDRAGIIDAGSESLIGVLAAHGYIQGSIPATSYSGSGLTREDYKNFASAGIRVFFVNHKIVPIEHPDAEQIFFEWVMAAEERKKRDEVK